MQMSIKKKSINLHKIMYRDCVQKEVRMFNLYDLVKRGCTFEELETSAMTLRLVVVELSELLGGQGLRPVFDEISNAIGKDTDNDFDSQYFLTSVSDLEKYFNGRVSDVKKDLAELEDKKYEMVGNARSQLRMLPHGKSPC